MLVPAGNGMWQHGMPAYAYRDVLDRLLTNSHERHISISTTGARNKASLVAKNHCRRSRLSRAA